MTKMVSRIAMAALLSGAFAAPALAGGSSTPNAPATPPAGVVATTGTATVPTVTLGGGITVGTAVVGGVIAAVIVGAVTDQ